MKLYDGGRAPDPRRVRMFPAEKSIDAVPPAAVDVRQPEHESDTPSTLDPMRRPPALVLDDGVPIAMSSDLEALMPAPPSFGRDAHEQALVDRWSRQLELGALVHVANLLRHSDPAATYLEVTQVREAADAGRPRVEAFSRSLDAELSGRTFVARGDFIADAVTSRVPVHPMMSAVSALHQGMPNVAHRHAALKVRPSAGA